MFRFALKLATFSVALTGLGLFLSGDKASAAVCNWAPSENWGVNVGEHSNAMAGMKVHAFNGQTNEQLNVFYEVRSQLVPHVNHNINGHDPDERIFEYPPGEKGRDKQHWFKTGENIRAGSSNHSCDGWSVLGPGTPTSQGNGWVLDCGQMVDGFYHETEFWISDIAKPAGQDGEWEIKVTKPGRAPKTGNLNNTPTFGVANGDDVRVDLIWHPAQPPDFSMNVACSAINLWDARDPNIPSAALRYRVWRGDGGGGKVQLVREGYVNGAGNISINPSANQQFIVKLFGKNASGAEDNVDRERQDRAPNNCDNPPNPDCNLVRFTIPNDSNALSSSNHWNTPDGQSYYAVYVNDWGSAGRPVPAGSPDYYPNGSGSPEGSGRYNDAPGPGVDYSSYDNLPASETVASGTGHVIERNLREHNKVVSGQLVWTLVVYDWFKNSSDVWRIQVQHRETHEINNCWQATCSVNITGDVPGREGTNAVRGGSVITGTVTVWNTGVNNLPSWMGTVAGWFGLSLTTNYYGGLSPNILDENIPPGGSITRPLEGFGFVAPNDVNYHNLSFYPDYWGRSGIGPWCNGGFQTFKEFDLSLSANTTLSPTKEDPSVSQHRATIGPGVTPVPVTVPYSARSTYNGAVINAVDTAGTTTINYAYDHTSFPNLKAGDEFCTTISTPNGRGWVGPGNQLSDANHPKSAGPACDTAHDRPYVSTYGGDTAAGIGGFYDSASGSCAANSGGLKAFTNSSGPKSGSGAQLAALSNGDISGFASASMTAGPLTLSFANTVNNAGSAGGDPNRKNLGGDFGQDSCMPNYFDSTQFENGSAKKHTTSSSGLSLSSLADNQQTVASPVTGRLILNGSSSYSRKHTLYVNGNVVINNNIIYAPWGSIADIPNFTLVVRGNIYIRPNVTELDGTYIAQPTTPGNGNSGKIYTCVRNNGSPFTTISNIDNICDNQLTVYGSLIAQQLRLLRTYKTLRNSLKKENYVNSKAAEKIIFSPEIYLSPPVFNTPGSSEDSIISTGIYEYITTLPPIL